MTELEKLKKRLFSDPVRRIRNFSFTPGPNATPETVAREVNRALDEIGERSTRAPVSKQPQVDVREYVRGL